MTTPTRWSELYEQIYEEIRRESRSPPGSAGERDDKDSAKQIATLRLLDERRREQEQEREQGQERFLRLVDAALELIEEEREAKARRGTRVSDILKVLNAARAAGKPSSPARSDCERDDLDSELQIAAAERLLKKRRQSNPQSGTQPPPRSDYQPNDADSEVQLEKRLRRLLEETRRQFPTKGPPAPR